jgi:hypothetical protein
MNDVKKEFPCDLCGDTRVIDTPYLSYYTVNAEPYQICMNCGLVYLKYRRSAEEIARVWSEEIFGEGYTTKTPARLARSTYTAEFIDINVSLKDKVVVDIGAGEGQFLEILKNQYGAKPYGIEPSKPNCDDMKSKGFDTFLGTIEDFEASGTKLDVDIATMLWTVEACTSCTDMMKIAHRMIKDDGYVVVATGSRVLVPFKKTLEHLFRGPRPNDVHPYYFSVNTLKGLFAITGFKPVYINRYYDTDWLVIIGQKQPEGTKIEWQGDNFVEVAEYFERWHHDTVHYYRGDFTSSIVLY